LDCAGKLSATALSRARDVHELSKTSRPGESGVALRLPPQSKCAGAVATPLGRSLFRRFVLWTGRGIPYIPAMVHVGIGYDVHQLVAGRKLVLGGVEIPHTKGLDGHSDADALMHAICDAVLGALGEEDIGHFFPNTDPRWRGAESRIFLREAAAQTAQRGGKIVNVDATVIAQAPKIYPYIAEMKRRIAAALGVTEKQIGVKATTNEHMGFVGREEGIAAMAVASINLPEPQA
jgi:2-C-methyl-D-erythritol 2,4-cyclodiphosphate synthase